MRYFPAFLIASLLFCLQACERSNKKEETDNVTGLWRGVILMQEQELPFHFRLSGHIPDSLHLTLINGEEQLDAGLARQEGDTLIFPMHIFDTEIRAYLSDNNVLNGYWIKNYEEDFRLPFRASKGENFRFESGTKDPVTDLSGRWAVNFQDETDNTHTYDAVAEFTQRKQELSGTFLTPTGDYRYLEGNISGEQFSLSTFDGERAFLFKGTAVDSNRLEGTFWSGKARKEKWTATRNPNASLPAADSLTYLKKGYDKLNFSFPNLEGEKVSLEDSRFKDKVVIVQLFGSWCPSCMDETKFLAEWYRKHKQQDVAIIGLAYEKKADFDYARQRVQTMADKLDAGYDFLIAGTADKEQAATTLPMLNHVMAFPTTIFLDKQHRIRRIHTGFSGPGTGKDFERWTEDFELLMNQLLSEPRNSTAAR